MKLICFTQHKVNNKSVYYLKTDNVLLRNNKDFYIPNFTKEVEADFNLLIKFNKIGKCIEKKFAARYFEQIGVAINFYAKDVEKELSEKNLPLSMSYCFDFSTAVSKQLINISEVNEDSLFSFHHNNQEYNFKLVDLSTSILDAIGNFSFNSHTKIGDYLILPFKKERFKLSIGDKLIAKIDDSQFLNFCIK
jgi:hypothetical protein